MASDTQPSAKGRETPLSRDGSGWGVRWAVLLSVAGWVGLLALCLWAGATGTAAVLMGLVAFGHGCARGRGAGAGAGVACMVIGLFAFDGLAVADGVGLAAGLVAAGLGGGYLRRRNQRVRERLATAEAGLAALRQSLEETRAETQALRRRLGQAERLATVGTMSAQIAHQLRNPLTSIGLYVQLVEDELHDLDPARAGEALELLGRVLRELKVLVEITDNYLQYARLPELETARLDVNPAVGDLVRFLRHEMERKGIAASTRLAEGLEPIEADSRLLRFALMNLLKNAIEAMDHGGRLRVQTTQRDGAVEIHVSDTGPGIPAEEAERIFEPFYTTKDAGSGLGLSLSRQIVEKHGGTLTCESMVGVGATFMIRLPARAGPRRTSDGGGQDPDDPHRR